MVIKLKGTDYIVGVWMAEQVYLGKVFVYSLKGTEDNQWVKYVKYIYVNPRYNMFMHDNDYKNIVTYNGLTETDIIKKCNEKINELSILFWHNKEKVMIGGDLVKYQQLSLKNPWLLPVSEVKESDVKKGKGC